MFDDGPHADPYQLGLGSFSLPCRLALIYQKAFPFMTSPSAQTTEPTPAQLEALAQIVALGQDGPFHMVNIIKYKPQADYPAEIRAPKRTGREAYGEYAAAVGPMIFALGGSVAFREAVELGFVGPADADEVIIIHYPSRQAYLDMFASAAYQEAIVHRKAGLVYRTLFACSAPSPDPPK